jgi:hypothetical protein
MGTRTGPSVRRTVGTTEQVSTVVAEAIADAAEAAPTELEPLASSIDPEALDALYESAGRGSHVTFKHAGYEVGVHGDGAVVVRPADETPGDTQLRREQSP